MEISAVIELLKQYGFSTFVAVYLLIRFDKLMTALNKAEEAERAILDRIVTVLERKAA